MAKRKKKPSFEERKKVICPALKLRAEAKEDTDTLCILFKRAVVTSDQNYKDEIWEHVITDNNVDGYCKKQFLESLEPDTTTVSREPEPVFAEESKCDGNIFVEEVAEDGDKEKD